MSLILPSPKGLLFDFDGVIVDSQVAHRAAWHSAAVEIWGDAPTKYPKELSGRAPREIARYFCELHGDIERLEYYLDLKLQHLLAQSEPPVLLPGARDLLEACREKGVPFGIASNAPRDFVTETVRKHNLPVKEMFGVDDYQNPKPHPEPYFKLAKALGIDKEYFTSAYVFEDSLTGMTAAVASGMNAIGVRTAYSADDLLGEGAKYTVGYLDEVEIEM